jgi:hypothetical protein
MVSLLGVVFEVIQPNLSGSLKTSIAASNKSCFRPLSVSSPAGAEGQQLLFSGRSRKAALPSAQAEIWPHIRLNALRKFVGCLLNRMWSGEFSWRFVSVNAGVM